MTEEKQILQQVSDATLQKPVTITVDIQPVNRYHALLQKWGILPKTKSFQLKPAVLGTLIKISGVLVSIDFVIPDGKDEHGNLLKANYDAIIKHGKSMATVVALAIENCNKEASPRLVKFIIRNFTTQEMFGVLSLVINKMDLQNFMSSIISIKGMNVLETKKNVSAASAES